MKKCFMLLVSFVLLGCGGVTTDITEKGTITISLGHEPYTIDPTLNTWSIASTYIAHAFEGLVTKDKEGKVTYGVADSFNISDDKLTYTFNIRSDAKWSDGKTVTAHDFVYSFRRVVDPNTGARLSPLMEPIKNAKNITAGDKPLESLGVVAIDDNTLSVTLEFPTAYFLELLTADTYYPVRQDIIEEYGEQWTLNPETYIGNGPFKVVERSIDDKIVMERNEYYWNASSIVPNKLVFLLIQNENTAVAGVKEGSLDFAANPPPQDIPLLTEEGLIYINPILATQYFVLNFTNKALKDPRVRKALSLSIDRNYLVEEITQGGETPAGAWIPYGVNDVEGDFRENGGDYYSVDHKDYEANVAEAKKLMLEAGYPNGEGFPVLELKTNPTALNTSLFEAVQQMWKEGLGIDSFITQEAVFFQTSNNKDFVVARHSFVAAYNDPMTFIDSLMSHSPQNQGGYSNARYDNLVNMARIEDDENVRMKAMHEAESILLEDMGLIPIYFYTQPLLVSPNLKGVIFDSLAVSKFNYAYIEE